MAGKKLTSDQKRAQRKREEEKRNRQRQHERNRRWNSMDELIQTARLAAMGEIAPEEVEASVLKNCQAKTVAASLKETSFKSSGWDQLRETTSRMVAMTRGDMELMESETPLIGRVYMIEPEGHWYSACFFPIEATVASAWELPEVFKNTAKEMDPQPQEGAYFFGLPLLSSAVHIAIASSTDPAIPYETYVVSEKGWHAIDKTAWRQELMPLLMQGMVTKKIIGDEDDITYATEALMLRQPSEEDPAEADSMGEETMDGEETLDRESRAIVRSLGSPLVDEMEAFIQATGTLKEAGRLAGYRNGVAAGQKEAAAESMRLKAQLEQLQQENDALKRRIPSPTHAPSTAPQPPENIAAQEVPLAQRMAALFS